VGERRNVGMEGDVGLCCACGSQGRDGSVSIETRYRPDGPVIESRGGRGFPTRANRSGSN
jgi:hypothetical protein